jgi:hypothetical protein
LGIEEDGVILESVYSEMNKEDTRFFQEVKESGVFSENTQLLPMAWKIHWEDAKLIDVSVISGGDRGEG